MSRSLSTKTTPESAGQSRPLSPPLAAVPKKSGYTLPPGLAIFIATKIAGLIVWWAGSHPVGILVYCSLDLWLLWQIMDPASTGFGPVVSRFQTDGRNVWLTIDDGPDPLTTPRVLELLDEYKARATFFVIGQNVRRHPQLALEIIRRGHTLANHSDTHPSASFWGAGPARVRREIDRCNSAMAAVGLVPFAYFRPPVGIKTPFLHAVLARREMLLVAWSARGFDSVVDQNTATRRILGQLRPGTIVLLHEGRSDLSRVTVIERVLQGISRAGFSTVIPERSSLMA